MSENSFWESVKDYIPFASIIAALALFFGLKKQKVESKKSTSETRKIDADAVAILNDELTEALITIRNLRDENDDQRIKIHELTKLNKTQSKSIAAIQSKLSVLETIQIALKK